MGANPNVLRDVDEGALRAQGFAAVLRKPLHMTALIEAVMPRPVGG